MDDPAPHTGTTIVAVTFPGGVVLGCDSRVSTGAYVSNRASDKLHPLSDAVWMLRSGSAADCQAIGDAGAGRGEGWGARACPIAPRLRPGDAAHRAHAPTHRPPSSPVRHAASQLATELGRPPTVRAVASVVRSINYTNKEALSGALLVAGWDAAAGGQIFGVPIGGALVPQPWATDGSGSTYIWGYLDAHYKDGLTRAQAEDLVVQSLALAVSTDGSSGGMARLVTVTKDGPERRVVNGDQMPLYSGAVEAGCAGDGLVVV